jgi:hypothetical protein
LNGVASTKEHRRHALARERRVANHPKTTYRRSVVWHHDQRPSCRMRKSPHKSVVSQGVSLPRCRRAYLEVCHRHTSKLGHSIKQSPLQMPGQHIGRWHIAPPCMCRKGHRYNAIRRLHMVVIWLHGHKDRSTVHTRYGPSQMRLHVGRRQRMISLEGSIGRDSAPCCLVPFCLLRSP